MAPQINFNHHDILQGNLVQLISQMDLPDLSSRVHIGHAGGAGYALFSEKSDKLYHDRMGNTFGAVSEIRIFFDAVYAYLDTAKEYAIKFGFRLLASEGHKFKEITSESEIFPKLISSYTLDWGVVIGDTKIESVERLIKFLEMIKEGKPILDQPYEAVKTAGRRYLQ